jgi:hypothetical protein
LGAASFAKKGGIFHVFAPALRGAAAQYKKGRRLRTALFQAAWGEV